MHRTSALESSRPAGNRWGRWLLLAAVLIVAASAALAYAYQRSGGDLERAVGSVLRASSDAGTAAQVKAALALSERVSAFSIDVESRGGAIHLVGTVPSEDVRELAGRIAAETRGVRSVRNALVVDPAARPDPELTRMVERVADLEIEAGVQQALLADGRIRAEGLSVDVEDRRVVLSGQVPGAEERYRAELAARSIGGVQAVENRLEMIEPATAVDADARLARAVEFELYSTRAFDLDGLAIAASKGTVGLTGRVRSEAERLLAERVAAEVAGVELVVNELALAEAEPESTREEG